MVLVHSLTSSLRSLFINSSYFPFFLACQCMNNSTLLQQCAHTHNSGGRAPPLSIYKFPLHFIDSHARKRRRSRFRSVREKLFKLPLRYFPLIPRAVQSCAVWRRQWRRRAHPLRLIKLNNQSIFDFFSSTIAPRPSHAAPTLQGRPRQPLRTVFAPRKLCLCERVLGQKLCRKRGIDSN